MSIHVEFYPGGYGPTISIVPVELAELVAIRRLFASLASGEESAADFFRALGCESTSVGALELRISANEPAKTLIRRGANRLGPEFWWANTREDWQACVELTDGLIESDGPGHQYLTREGVDDALIELCFMEGL